MLKKEMGVTSVACYLLVLICLAPFLTQAPTTAHGYYDGPVGGGVGDAANNKDSSVTWSDWARDKMTEGLGHRHENAKKAAQQMMDAAGDISKKTRAKMSDMASGGAEKAGEAKDVAMEKAGEAKDCMMDAAGINAEENVKKLREAGGGMASGAYRAVDATSRKAGEAKEFVMDKAGQASEAMRDAAITSQKRTGEMAGEAKDAMMDRGGRWAYQGAKRNAERAYGSAKDTYDSAKEKASQAATTDMNPDGKVAEL